MTIQIPEKYLWLYRYSSPCHFGRLKAFSRLLQSNNFKPLVHLNNDFSREAVKIYFLGLHNKVAYEEGHFQHMVISYDIISLSPIKLQLTEEFPYNLLDEYQQKILNKRRRRRMKNNGFDSSQLNLRDIIYIHSGWPVDIDKK